MIYNQAVAHVVRAIDNGFYGGTYSTRGAAVPTTGYWVGGSGDTIVVERDHDRDHLRYLIHSVVVATQSEWVGFWFNPESNYYEIDGVSWTEDVDQAIKWAQDRGEKAFHAIRSGTDLWLSN